MEEDIDLQATTIPVVRLFRPTKHGDHRGFFSEVYNKNALEEAGIDIDQASHRSDFLRSVELQAFGWHRGRL